jgi:spectrin alpha
LNESKEFQLFIAKVEEEEAWMNEKQQILGGENFGENMAAVQGLLKKHDAFEVDLEVHRQRIQDLIDQGQQLINAGNHHSGVIQARCQQLQSRLDMIGDLAKRRLARLRDNSAYLQFMWKCDVVESWIGQLVRFDSNEMNFLIIYFQPRKSSKCALMTTVAICRRCRFC